MLRKILAVVVGLIVMMVIVSAGFTAGVFGLGLDWILEPGRYEATMRWSLIAMGTGLVAAAAGGLVCAIVSRSSGAPKVLAACVLVLGALSAITTVVSTRPDPGPRPAGELMGDTLKKLEEPTWVAIANPVVGCVGVMIGARVGRRRR